MGERYAELVEALYSGASEVGLETEIQYQDGRVRRMSGTIRIADVQGA